MRHENLLQLYNGAMHICTLHPSPASWYANQVIDSSTSENADFGSSPSQVMLDDRKRQNEPLLRLPLPLP